MAWPFDPYLSLVPANIKSPSEEAISEFVYPDQ